MSKLMWVAGLTVALLAVSAWLAFATARNTQGVASDATISIDSGTVMPGEDVTVFLTITPTSGKIVGSLYATIDYNNSVVSVAGLCGCHQPREL